MGGAAVRDTPGEALGDAEGVVLRHSRRGGKEGAAVGRDAGSSHGAGVHAAPMAHPRQLQLDRRHTQWPAGISGGGGRAAFVSAWAVDGMAGISSTAFTVVHTRVCSGSKAAR